MDATVYSSCPCCGSNQVSARLSARDYTVSQEDFEIWQCGHCTARFTQNVPGKSSIGRYYQSENYISHTDTKKGLINSLYHIIRKRTLDQKRRLVEESTGKKKGRLLDLGAGTGAFAAHLQKAGWDAVGLEPDQDSRKRAIDFYGIELKDSSEFMSMPAESFDALTMWHVLEHVHDLHEYLEQIRRVLKPAARAFIAVPNYTSPDAVHYGKFWAAYDVPRHLYHFSPASMKILMQKHGMKVLAMQPMWYDSFYVSMLSEQYKNGSPAHLKAFFTGLQSDIKVLADKEKCSSLVYIVGK